MLAASNEEEVHAAPILYIKTVSYSWNAASGNYSQLGGVRASYSRSHCWPAIMVRSSAVASPRFVLTDPAEQSGEHHGGAGDCPLSTHSGHS